MYDSVYLGLNKSDRIVFTRNVRDTRYNIVLNEKCLNNDSLKSILKNSLEGMTELQKKVTLLLYYEDLSIGETALVLKITEQYVYNILSVVVKIIQAFCNQEDDSVDFVGTLF